MTTLAAPNSPSPRSPNFSAVKVLTAPTARLTSEDPCVDLQKPSLIPTKEDATVGSDEHEVSATLWDVVCSVYMPLVFLWLRRSMESVIHWIRVVFLGQFVGFILTHVIPWETVAHSWQQYAGQDGTSKPDLHSWPPPAFAALVMFTVIVLMIHPDGTTWALLGKMRDGIMTLLDSTKFCWDFMLQESSMLPTIVAAGTFLALFGVIWILHRTLTPRTPKKQVIKTPEKHKKKKRRGNHRAGRGRSHNRNRPATGTNNRPIPENSTAEGCLSPVTQEELLGQENLLHLKTSVPPNDESGAEKSSNIVQTKRPRTESLDSAATDDQSCETDSVRSSASGLTSTTSHTDSIRAAVDGVAHGRTSRTSGASLSRRRTAKRNTRSTIAAFETSGDLIMGHTHRKQKATVSTTTFPLPAVTPIHEAPAHMSSSSFFSSTPEARAPELPKNEGRSIHTADRQRASPSFPFHEPMVPCKTPTLEPFVGSQSSERVRLPPGFECGTPGRSSYACTSVQNAKKMELSTLLSQVNLVGMVRSDLLEDLDDIDALDRMSDAQYELYNVPLAQKAHIELLLDLRRHSTVSPMTSPSTGIIAPPPGLQIPPHEKSKMNFSDTVDLPFLTSPPRRVSLSSLDLPNLDPSGQSRSLAAQFPLSIYRPQNSPDKTHENNEDVDEESTRIEAELQELGGQMVGSVLDF